MKQEYKLIFGDSEKVLAGIEDHSIGLTVTSPPYYDMLGEVKWKDYETFMFKMKQIFKEVYRVTKPGRAVAVNVPFDYKYKGKEYDVGIDFYNMLKDLNFKSAEKIVWQKPAGYGGANSCMKRFGNFIQRNYPFYYLPDRACEFIWIMSKGRMRRPKITKEVEDSIVTLGPIQRAAASNVWKIPTASSDAGRKKWGKNGVHPAMFSTQLSDLVVQLYSLVGDVVLDPFGGSGTVGLSSRNFRRSCILIEIDRKYEKMIKEKVGWMQNNLDGNVKYNTEYDDVD
jgi:DNA modification methylase